MEIYALKNLSFTYPNRDKETLKNINLSVNEGEFILLCGKSGCGKTTLLRLLKSSLSPFGHLKGEILYKGKQIEITDLKTQAAEIGFVLQNPDSQIVTDKVWHELAFGMESLGIKTPEIRTRVSEMASFFGIQNSFYKKTSELSGGQKQLLNLASVMVTKPEVLILDEPTSGLDPIAASEFLSMLKKVKDELGTTIILTEHRPEEAFAISDRVIVMDEGEIIADDTPENVGRVLKEKNHEMYRALPAPMRIFGSLEDCDTLPITVREGKMRLLEYSKTHAVNQNLIPKDKKTDCLTPAIEIKDVYFRYEKDLPDVTKGLNLTVYKGELFAILGGNGTGKTTALSLVSGLYTPNRGKVLINGCEISKIKHLYDGLLGVLPQNPQSLFAKKTVFLNLMEMTDRKLNEAERKKQVYEISSLCKIKHLLDFHPYDLSGGEQQRAALAMVLLKKPQILILDEPTKGMDAHFKQTFADVLYAVKDGGATILMVSHDIEFCAEFADRCAMFFDGSITSQGTPREFFCGNGFYTTSTNRMAQKLLPCAILPDDVILALGGKISPKREKKEYTYTLPEKTENKKKKPKLTSKRIVSGVFFILCCIAAQVLQKNNNYILKAVSLAFAALGIAFLFPQNEIETRKIKTPKGDRKLSKRTLAAAVLSLIAVPLTICFGAYFLGDRKYYFISILIILETILPFFMVFEKRKPKAREIVIISVLSAVSVAGRTAFFMLPQFKPVVALVVISGVCFGGEAGFLVGSITAFVSNFIFGQGPWTPWQMFSFGIIGFIAGVLFKKGFLIKTKASLSVFGFLATLVIYGGIMNTASVLMITSAPTLSMLKTAYIMGFPLDFVHALSSFCFLWLFCEPMTEKLERVKVKYGLIEE